MTASILPFGRSSDIERHQSVAAEEAALIAAAETRRLALVRRASPTLFGLRSELNRIDDVLCDRANTCSRLLARSGHIGEDRWSPPFAPWVFWLVMGFLLILEIPVNAAAIDLLRLPVAESYMLATFFALGNLIGAKYSGRAIRQWSADMMPVRTCAVAALANMALLGGLLALALLRSDAADGVGGPWAFLALQLMFYAIALLASFLQTPRSAEAEQDELRFRRAERAFRSCWAKRSHIARRHNVVLSQVQASVRRVEHDCARRISLLRARRWVADGDEQCSEPITQANFEPLDLGEPVDHHPVRIEMVVPPRKLA